MDVSLKIWMDIFSTPELHFTSYLLNKLLCFIPVI